MRAIVERGAIAVALLALYGMPGGSRPAVAESAFALMPPEVVAGLRLKNDAPEARAAIRAANGVAHREPHALPRVHTEGTLPHQGIYDESKEAVRDWAGMRDLGLGFALSREDIYLRAAERYFAAWLDVYRVSLNPIDETGLDNVMLAYDLVGARLPQDLRRKMTRLTRELATGYLLVQPDAGRSTTINNWQSHRVKLIALSAFSLNEPELIAESRRAFQSQLDYNLRGDGSTLDFEQRDALHYVVYDLEPLVTAALVAKAHGLDWYSMKSRSGASLDTALEWLEPYATGERVHEEFVHTTVDFDRARAAAGLPGFSGRFDPKVSAMLYQLAARLNPRWSALAMRLGPASPWLALCFPL